jgi:hypothetical protein
MYAEPNANTANLLARHGHTAQGNVLEAFMADEWGVNYRPRPKYQFVWWPRLQFWFVRDAPPLAHVYSWRLSLGPLEIRRWNYSPAA